MEDSGSQEDIDQWEKDLEKLPYDQDTEYDAQAFWTALAIVLMFSIWVGIFWMIFT